MQENQPLGKKMIKMNKNILLVFPHVKCSPKQKWGNSVSTYKQYYFKVVYLGSRLFQLNVTQTHTINKN